jgi:Tol biopolymer transport system component
MSLTPGTRIGVYEIIGAIGVGGMGEVYRARDARLRRDVAIKVLPDIVAADPERMARFEREAQLLASLSHPHIASVYGLEEAGPLRALVMELVEGPTLAERVAVGPAPLEEALPIAREMADALEAAHERSIIHRDLKPANVKLTADGHVKILDFGLAKALEPVGAAGSVTDSPTLTARGTALGAILGTAAYMAPEQARGKAVDRRADVWAFGCVLYELLTGRRAFPGDEITDVLAKVIERDPDLAALPARTPAAVRQLLSRCLTKDARQRLRDIGEARVLLEREIAADSAAGAPARAARPAGRDRRVTAAWAVAVTAAIVAAAALAWPRAGAPTPPAAPLRVSLTLPPDVEYFGRSSISADGSVVAFVAVREGVRHVYVRKLGDFAVTPLRGTEAVSLVTLSPNGRSVAFITTDNRLLRMSVDGGVVQSLAAADFAAAMTWRTDDTIVFGRDGRFMAVPAAGGDPRELTTLDAAVQEQIQRYPVASADGSLLLFTSFAGADVSNVRLVAMHTAGGRRGVLLEADAQPIWVARDRIVFAQDGALFVCGFDADQLRLVGAPVRVLQDLGLSPVGGWAASVSNTGSLLFASGEVSRARLVVVDERGMETVLAAPARSYSNPRLSPNERTVLFTDIEGLWMLDVARLATTRLAAGVASHATWSQDGQRVFFRTPTGTQMMTPGMGADPQRVHGSTPNDYPASTTPDGATLVTVRLTPSTSGDLYLFSLNTSDPPRALLGSRAYEGGGQISPDGRWMAYTTDESGRNEVYLRPFPGPDRRWPVSTAGGLHPLWSRDGRRIFFRSGQQLLAVDVTLTPEVSLSPPRVLFERRYSFGPNLSLANYTLSPNGRGFLMVQEEPGARSLHLILNWLQGLP